MLSMISQTEIDQFLSHAVNEGWVIDPETGKIQYLGCYQDIKINDDVFNELNNQRILKIQMIETNVKMINRLLNQIREIEKSSLEYYPTLNCVEMANSEVLLTLVQSKSNKSIDDCKKIIMRLCAAYKIAENIFVSQHGTKLNFIKKENEFPQDYIENVMEIQIKSFNLNENEEEDNKNDYSPKMPTVYTFIKMAFDAFPDMSNEDLNKIINKPAIIIDQYIKYQESEYCQMMSECYLNTI